MNGKDIILLINALKAVQDLIEHSKGVAGLHMNGDIAPWQELLEGGSCEDWLEDFSLAMELVNRGYSEIIGNIYENPELKEEQNGN